MAAPPPAVAAIRVAVRRCLATHAGGIGRQLVLVACSGGADSLSLAIATGFVAARTGLRCGLVTVDHGLQAGSDERAASVASWAVDQGFAPVSAVSVDARAHPGGPGPEGAARHARYAALAAAARDSGATAVLLGHTLEDQAETVLLALARGSGPRGISGMPERRMLHGVAFLRPLLTVERAQTRAACAAVGLKPWEDPHNTDSSYARARVRALLPVLADALGPGVVRNLARTARLVATDSEYLDRVAADACDPQVVGPGSPLAVQDLAALPAALRRRVLRRWALGCGAPSAALSSAHIEALDALVVRWRGQGAVALPGSVAVSRRNAQLVAHTTAQRCGD